VSRVTRFFILASLLYLCIGVTIGIFLISHTNAIGGFLAMHAHTNLLGWVSMMIFAVAYHVLPRFSGRPLYSERLADLHLILSNIGLIGLMILWPLSKYVWSPVINILLTGSAIFYAISSYLFVFNLWKTVFTQG